MLVLVFIRLLKPLRFDYTALGATNRRLARLTVNYDCAYCDTTLDTQNHRQADEGRDRDVRHMAQIKGTQRGSQHKTDRSFSP